MSPSLYFGFYLFMIGPGGVGKPLTPPRVVKLRKKPETLNPKPSPVFPVNQVLESYHSTSSLKFHVMTFLASDVNDNIYLVPIVSS